MPGKWKKNVWKGPNRKALQAYFHNWAQNLFLGIATEPKPLQEDNSNEPLRFRQGSTASKMQKHVIVQSEGGYQNEFLFAQRCPTTEAVWDKLQQQQTSMPAATRDNRDTMQEVKPTL